jgi:hypothetical protein
MRVPSRRLKELIEGRVDHPRLCALASAGGSHHQLARLLRQLTGYLSDNDDDTIKLCRIQYLGDPDDWASAIWQSSSDSYAGAVLLDGSFTGHPSQAPRAARGLGGAGRAWGGPVAYQGLSGITYIPTGEDRVVKGGI